jgi:hypothetical protein
VPNLGMFTYRNEAVYQVPLEMAQLGLRLGYGLAWIALLIALTVIVFRRKQL